MKKCRAHTNSSRAPWRGDDSKSKQATRNKLVLTMSSFVTKGCPRNIVMRSKRALQHNQHLELITKSCSLCGSLKPIHPIDGTATAWLWTLGTRANQPRLIKANNALSVCKTFRLERLPLVFFSERLNRWTTFNNRAYCIPHLCIQVQCR